MLCQSGRNCGSNRMAVVSLDSKNALRILMLRLVRWGRDLWDFNFQNNILLIKSIKKLSFLTFLSTQPSLLCSCLLTSLLSQSSTPRVAFSASLFSVYYHSLPHFLEFLLIILYSMNYIN